MTCERRRLVRELLRGFWTTRKGNPASGQSQPWRTISRKRGLLIGRSFIQWVREGAALPKLLVRFMEGRAGIPAGDGTVAARLDRAAQARKRRLPELKRTLKKLCDIYVRLRSPKRRREIAGQIQNLDSGICLIQRGEAAVILSAVYLYYRAELDSAGVSAEIGIKPPAVRQILWKMNKLWEREIALNSLARLPSMFPTKPRRSRLPRAEKKKGR